MTIELAEPEPSEDSLVVSPELVIPPGELTFRFSRSGGPGGQHVNRSETRVELLFNVANSPSLSEEQRVRILRRLAGQIDKEGVLRVVSSATRSQLANRADALARLQTLLEGALQQHRHRVATRPSGAARQRRLEQKRQRSQVKKTRGRVDPTE